MNDEALEKKIRTLSINQEVAEELLNQKLETNVVIEIPVTIAHP